MIIQCKQCKTKFRFDDAQMEGDGLWMRCSRCQHVFFQDNPAKMKPLECTPEPVREPEKEVPPQPVKSLSFEPATPVAVPGSQDEDMKAFMKEVIGDEKVTAAPPAAIPAVEPPPPQPVMDEAEIDFEQTLEKRADALEGSEEGEEEPQPPPKKKSSKWQLALWAVFVIVVIPALVYFVFFPHLGERYIQIAQKYIGGSAQSTDGPVVMAQVKLQDVRQRVINNYVAGNIRIVEGTAVNQADFAVARIRVKGEILDAYGVVLGERVSFAGNVLSEDELANMTEDEIQKRLSHPEGRNNSNEKVLPNGRIPFMIVFTREPPGSIKTTVTVTGAEKLL